MRKAALTGLVGREKIILAALRYFFPPSLAFDTGKSQTGASKKPEYRLLGAGHVKHLIQKVYVILQFQEL